MRIIGGQHRGKKLYSPESKTTRPTSDRVRESLFNILEHGYAVDWSKTSVLDLFAGTGAVGVEALSRGAKNATFVEQDKLALTALYKNTDPYQNKFIEETNVFDTYFSGGIKFDLVYIDPPYNQEIVEKVLMYLEKIGCLSLKSLVIFELDKTEKLLCPLPFSIHKEKVYGRTKLVFIKYK